MPRSGKKKGSPRSRASAGGKVRGRALTGKRRGEKVKNGRGGGGAVSILTKNAKREGDRIGILPRTERSVLGKKRR